MTWTIKHMPGVYLKIHYVPHSKLSLITKVYSQNEANYYLSISNKFFKMDYLFPIVFQRLVHYHSIVFNKIIVGKDHVASKEKKKSC
jgi:hypothetical protein